MQLKFVSPGKTVYRTEKSVAKTLTARNLESCFHEALASSEETEDSEDLEYLPDIEDSPPDELVVQERRESGATRRILPLHKQPGRKRSWT